MNKPTIALVDDHAMLRNGLASLIKDMNKFDVIAECGNGKEFIQEVSENNIEPNIVLLDISMPVMDGFETAKWITKNLADSKILVLSMMDDEKNVIKMLQLGARGYILKDGDPYLLEKALGDLLTRDYHFNDLVGNKLVHSVKMNEPYDDPRHIQISPREEEFLRLCCSEHAYKEIADMMGVSPRTVDGYRDILFRKLELKTRVGLVLFAIKNRIYEVQ